MWCWIYAIWADYDPVTRRRCASKGPYLFWTCDFLACSFKIVFIAEFCMFICTRMISYILTSAHRHLDAYWFVICFNEWQISMQILYSSLSIILYAFVAVKYNLQRKYIFPSFPYRIVSTCMFLCCQTQWAFNIRKWNGADDALLALCKQIFPLSHSQCTMQQ